ncbi:unnamed protein product [Lactuca virosa]|uniref:Uncharacterized protein n=1 Tax=Lactuca virosa TaxID=75947 RepID=A0AAU9PD11_9ASTR|nr:unnamed protein product [Lactuca virosa]
MGELEGRILARQLGRHIRLKYATGVCSHTVFHPLFLSLVSLKITVMISDFQISGVSLFVFVCTFGAGNQHNSRCAIEVSNCSIEAKLMVYFALLWSFDHAYNLFDEMFQLITLHLADVSRSLIFNVMGWEVVALVPKCEVDGEMGDAHMAMREIKYSLNQVIFKFDLGFVGLFSINSKKDKMGIMLLLEELLQHLFEKASLLPMLWQDSENRTLLSNLLIKNSSQRPKILTVEDNLMVVGCK